MANATPTPLADLRIIDLSTHLSGPLVSTILAALGADVIKVERGPSGEPSRNNPPLFIPQGREEPSSITFENRNRGKRSVLLDLKSSGGRKAFLDLCAVSDIVVENFRPRTLERLGISFDAMQSRNSDISLCSISGFGATGGKSDWMAYDTIIQAYSGVMAHTGDDSSGPLRTGVSVADNLGGLYGAIAVLAAVLQRTKTGRGRVIEISMLEAALTLVWDEPWSIHEHRGVPARSGNALPRACPWNSYAATDGLVVICVPRDDQWRRLADLMAEGDDTGIVGTLRDRDQEWRIDNRPLIDGIVETWVRKRDRASVTQQLQSAGVPAGPVLSSKEVGTDPEWASNRSLIPLRGMYRANGEELPVTSWDLPFLSNGKRLWSLAGCSAPAAGEHNREILIDVLGYSSAQADSMIAAALTSSLEE